MTIVGHAFIHMPADPDGLWIHRAAAAALNARDAGEMREGFRTELYNKRGAHWVDPTGKPERELAENACSIHAQKGVFLLACICQRGWHL